MERYINKNKGSVLIITILISTVLLTVGLSITAIIEKDLLRQLYAQRSEQAFRILDSAVECTLYNDLHNFSFRVVGAGSEPLIFRCNGLDVFTESAAPIEVFNNQQKQETYKVKGTVEFEFILVDSPSCAEVLVVKECITSGTGTRPNNCVNKSSPSTTIEIKGYDVCTRNNGEGFDFGEERGGLNIVRRQKLFY